jgi:competence protein ComEC
MPVFSLGIIIATIVFQCLSTLPTLKALLWLTVLTMVLSVAFHRKQKYVCLLFGFLLGVVLVYHAASQTINHRIQSGLEGKTLQIQGYIATIPTQGLHAYAFDFKLKSIGKKPTTGLVHLSWQEPKNVLHVGDEWRLWVKLKKPYGLLNPGGFDYEAWSLQANIIGNGYVVNKMQNEFIRSHHISYFIQSIRERLKTKLIENLKVSETSPWIIALATGERSNIDASAWEVLRRTGTNHLMAIAGLHIGIMAMLAHTLIHMVWRRFTVLMLYVPATEAASLGGLLMALVYSFLSGFSLPAQRASIMLSMAIACGLLRRQVSLWAVWIYSILITLIINPECVLGESFWLSFGSVALIIYGMSGRLYSKSVWWKWGRIQWVIALGLFPFSIALFQQFSLLSFVANSFAIPFVGFLVVPLTLLGSVTLMVSTHLGIGILSLADAILRFVWSGLVWLSHSNQAVFYQQVSSAWMLLASLLGIIILLLPKGFPGRLFGVTCSLPLILCLPTSPLSGEFKVSVLDIGQGLATVVQTQQHLLVFDTGSHINNMDMGERVVVPFLRTLHKPSIDLLVISHGDNDHLGGAAYILKNFNVLGIKTSVPAKLSQPADYCLQGDTWKWDDVTFRFLYPTMADLNLNNDSSCVLSVSNGFKTILLTGDIEKLAEQHLVANQSEYLKADVLVAPHHGSKTSADNAFLDAVKPHDVVFSIGYRNRYHFPNSAVISKYVERGVNRYDTVTAGAIQYTMTNTADNIAPSLYRPLHKHYWNNG